MAYCLHEDRLFTAEKQVRSIAREIYSHTKALPIISPHGHTDPVWYAKNQPFDNPAAFLVTPDHYVFRLLYSQGISLESLGIHQFDRSSETTVDPREIWRLFSKNFHLFLGTPTRLWITHALTEVLGVDEPLDFQSADRIYDHISARLDSEDFLPRNLYTRFNIEVIATTESAVDNLENHKIIRDQWPQGRVITTFRPDDITDPEHPDFHSHMDILAVQTGKNVHNWQDYLEAIRIKRLFFKSMGATATDHGFPTAYTTVLSERECQRMLSAALNKTLSEKEAEQFRGHMLIELARMSCDDGLVMQLHAGCDRNHNRKIFKHFGPDKGADIPVRVDFTGGLKPLLNEVGNSKALTLILFCMDESTYSRELAPLAGHYPALRLGPAWWFHDSPEGMMRYRRLVTETAGFYNTVGFNDDTRAFLSIPARHDVARRVDANFLAHQVSEHLMTMDEAVNVANDLAYHLPKKAYKL